jgi:hypothetical protein
LVVSAEKRPPAPTGGRSAAGATMSRNNPDYVPVRTTDREGREVLVYPDGFTKDAKTGFYIQPAKQNKITSETSALYRQHRKERNQQAAEEGIIEALNENKKFSQIKGGAEAMKIIAKVITRIALNGKHDRDRIDAADKVVKMADLLPRDNFIENQTNILNVDPETAKAILQMVQQLAEGGTISGAMGESITADIKELPNEKKWV